MGHRVSTPVSGNHTTIIRNINSRQSRSTGAEEGGPASTSTSSRRHNNHNNHHTNRDVTKRTSARALTAALLLCAASTHIASASSSTTSCCRSCSSANSSTTTSRSSSSQRRQQSDGVVPAFASITQSKASKQPLLLSSSSSARFERCIATATVTTAERYNPHRNRRQSSSCFQFRRKESSSAYVEGTTRPTTTAQQIFPSFNSRRRYNHHNNNRPSIATPLHFQEDSDFSSDLMGDGGDDGNEKRKSLKRRQDMEQQDDDNDDEMEDNNTNEPLDFEYSTTRSSLSPSPLSTSLFRDFNHNTSPRVSGATSLQRYYKRIHYNDALLNRILNGRTSSNSRWRKKTRRAAASLGFNPSSRIRKNQHHSDFVSSSSYPDVSTSSTTTTTTGTTTRSSSKDAVDTIFLSRPVPPRSSSLSTTTTTTPKKTTTTTTTKRHKRKKNRKTPLTEEQYQNAKLEWAARYTSLPTLRSRFGTNRNKFWGDFDTTTTRKLYNTLLPRALLGLYEMGLWSPTDLAPLAYEARLAAKKYARERSAVPGRVLSMLYDGFRSWRVWGTWSMEGMSWEQVWNKYETQILEEMVNDTELYNDEDHDVEEEMTAQICLRILERSCITNTKINELLLGEDYEAGNFDGTKKGRKNAERYLTMIAAKLEMDVQELLEENEQQQQQIVEMDTGTNVTSVSFLPPYSYAIKG